MASEYHFYTKTELSKGLKDLFCKLEQTLELDRPIKAFLAGGMAVHLYTGARSTGDIDAEFNVKLAIPEDLVVEVESSGHRKQLLFFDKNYNPSFALMHEDYVIDSVPVDIGLTNIEVRALHPTDLAVSKIARFADNDREDIQALVKRALTSSSSIEKRALEALGDYVGNTRMLELNIRDAVKISKDVEDFLAAGDAQEEKDAPKG